MIHKHCMNRNMVRKTEKTWKMRRALYKIWNMARNIEKRNT